MVDLESGWLMRTCRDAHMRCMLDMGPVNMQHLRKIETPIPTEEARELYDRMNDRFKAWTGLDLSDMKQS